MALLSFVESAPRAYRLKVGNADLFRNSTEPGTSPWVPVVVVFVTVLGVVDVASTPTPKNGKCTLTKRTILPDEALAFLRFALIRLMLRKLCNPA